MRTFLCKVIPGIIFISVIIGSCTEGKIIIRSGDSSTGKLTLEKLDGTPADLYHVDFNQKIKWIRNGKTNVRKLLLIDKKTGSETILQKPAHKKFLSKNWAGRVVTLEQFRSKTYLNDPAYEEYFIDWIDKKGKTHRYDPKIQLPGK